jgi:hypothetical protein
VVSCSSDGFVKVIFYIVCPLLIPITFGLWYSATRYIYVSACTESQIYFLFIFLKVHFTKSVSFNRHSLCPYKDYFMFCWMCNIMYQCSRTNKMQFLFSVKYKLTATTCFQHYLLIIRRRLMYNSWYIACVLCWLAATRVGVPLHFQPWLHTQYTNCLGIIDQHYAPITLVNKI